MPLALSFLDIVLEQPKPKAESNKAPNLVYLDVLLATTQGGIYHSLQLCCRWVLDQLKPQE